MRRPYALVEPHAVALALRALEKIYKADPGAHASEAWLGLSKEERERPAGSPVVVKQNTAKARNILEPLLRALDEAHNQSRAEKLRTALKEHFGERAYQKVTWQIQWERQREAERTYRADLLPAGVHIAPFLSPDGNVVLVAVGGGGAFGCSAECGPLIGSLYNVNEDCDELTAKSKVEMHDSAKTVMEVVVGETTKDDPYGEARKFLRGGIHRAPWRPWRFPQGVSLLAVGKDGRLIASMDAANLEEEKSVRRELAVLVEMLSPAEPYKDGYGESLEDSDDDFGEEWKK